jgi:prepilin-type N-terminal cleavage/methylation domain-containing protein
VQERGFTFLEVMLAVAVVGALAMLAVPTFFRESRKVRGKTEVTTIFAELSTKEDQYKVLTSSYLSAAACPASPNVAGQDATGCVATGQPWDTLKVTLPTPKLGCSYAITAGASGTTPSPPSPFTMSTPAGAWFYIVATCDMDGSSTTNSRYFTNSVDPTLQIDQEAK